MSLVVSKKLGAAIQTPLWSTIGGCVLVLLIWGIVLLGVKVFRNTMRILFYISLLAILVAIVMFSSQIAHQLRMHLIKVTGNGSYEKIIQLAKDNGWSTPSIFLVTNI